MLNVKGTMLPGSFISVLGFYVNSDKKIFS
jgi:hypothetical protein